jgi:putative DNA primase/helicase
MPIPSELMEYKQWVLWRRTDVNGRLAKLPISPWSGKVASCDKPQTWSTYRHVCYARRKFRSDGIGFVFTSKDPFCGIDLDQGRTLNGKIEPEAQAVIEHLASYTELSPSRTGIHVLLKAKLSGSGRRSGKVEIYDSGRYFTVTGQQLAPGRGSVENRQVQLDDLISEIFTRDETTRSATNSATLFASDEELIERAKSAKNGDRFIRLWAGDMSDFSGDHSRADLALCRMLSFWCQGNLDRVDRLFRQSGLMRDKWDRPCGAMRYGERTIVTLSSRAE